MEFIISDTEKSINDIMRTLGYQSAYFQKEGEFSMIKKIGVNEYPRFHLYIEEKDDRFFFKLHLDQKKPSYRGSTGHSGDYDGKVVEGEVERIKSLLTQ